MRIPERLSMTNKYILQIDSASDVPMIGITSDGTKIDSIKIEGLKLTDTLLTKIEEILKKNHLGKKDIKAIEVNPGPGPYTSLRVGITVANILAFGLNIPIRIISGKSDIVEDKYLSPVMPKYGSLPNITKPRPRLK